MQGGYRSDYRATGGQPVWVQLRFKHPQHLVIIRVEVIQVRRNRNTHIFLKHIGVVVDPVVWYANVCILVIMLLCCTCAAGGLRRVAAPAAGPDAGQGQRGGAG